jgi:hypothetical protein
MTERNLRFFGTEYEINRGELKQNRRGAITWTDRRR